MTSRYENQKMRKGYTHVIGCDEVGRGCLAGPVVAAAVAFAPASLKLKVKSYKGIKDSKLLTADTRQKLSEIIKQHALWGIGVVDEKVIDKINIHQATLLAMKKAVEGLLCHCEEECSRRRSNLIKEKDCFGQIKPCPRNDKVFLFVDGQFTIPGVNIEQEAVVGGDNKVLSVAAASIVAKVYRDELMKHYHQQYPIYNFAQHKGYATLYHRRMVIKHGLSKIHRLSFCEHLI